MRWVGFIYIFVLIDILFFIEVWSDIIIANLALWMIANQPANKLWKNQRLIDQNGLVVP